MRLVDIPKETDSVDPAQTAQSGLGPHCLPKPVSLNVEFHIVSIPDHCRFICFTTVIS